MKSTICVHYQIISKKSNKIIIDNFGWFNNEDEAINTLKSQYVPSLFTIKTTTK